MSEDASPPPPPRTEDVLAEVRECRRQSTRTQRAVVRPASSVFDNGGNNPLVSAPLLTAYQPMMTALPPRPADDFLPSNSAPPELTNTTTTTTVNLQPITTTQWYIIGLIVTLWLIDRWVMYILFTRYSTLFAMVVSTTSSSSANNDFIFERI